MPFIFNFVRPKIPPLSLGGDFGRDLGRLGMFGFGRMGSVSSFLGAVSRGVSSIVKSGSDRETCTAISAGVGLFWGFADLGPKIVTDLF